MIGKLEMATELIEYLENHVAKGYQWVVYDTDHPITSIYDLHCFANEIEALDFAGEYQQIWNWHEAIPIGNVLYNLREPDSLRLKASDITNNETSLKTRKDMNLNNLEDLKDEMKKLGFSDPLIAKMEEHMRNDDPNFKLYDNVKANKEQVDITLHFKQSGQSDYYYLNRLEAVHNQLKPLEEGHKYMVITKMPEGQENSVKKLENLSEAIELFNKQKGNAELAFGKNAASKTMVANMEEGKVNYVSREFKRDFYSPPMPQIFWLDHGKGFSREQAANLVQGRSVYRDDLLSREGTPYKAWMQLDTEKERDRNKNLTFRQFTDKYGYEVKTLLDEYKIREMADPKKAEALEISLMNGNRPLVTVEKDGQDVKMYLETAVRYGKLNFYAENGKPEKREQFQKETGLEVGNIFARKMEQGKDKDKEVAQGQGIGV